MIKLSRIKPSKIICYGKPFDEMKGDNRGYFLITLENEKYMMTWEAL